MPYDANGEAYDPDENGGIIKAAAAAIACILLIAVCWRIAATQPETVDNQPTYRLVLDCGNAALMHAYGMPTKADVMEWHMSGRWGWIEDGRLIAFDELPGDSRAWDELYGIDSDNPAFDK